MRHNYSRGILVAHKLQAVMNKVRICWLILYSYGLHCRSICSYMDPCEMISTEDTESSVDITLCVWCQYHLTLVHINTCWPCNEVRNGYNYIITYTTIMAVKNSVLTENSANCTYEVKIICYPLKYSMHRLPIPATTILIITAYIIMTLFTTPSFVLKSLL